MSGVTVLGKGTLGLGLAVCGLAESALARFRQRKALLLPWLGIPIALGVTGWLKVFVGRPRPAELLQGLGVTIAESGSSFPSGHATVACAVAAALSIRWPKGKVIWWSVAALVGLSRIALGLHWPSDVAAGALIGCGVVSVLLWVEERFWIFKKN